MWLGFLLDQRPTRRPRADGNGERIDDQEPQSATYKAVRTTGPSSVTAIVCSLCARSIRRSRPYRRRYRPRQASVRELYFDHPYAAVALVGTGKASNRKGLPLFAAWVSRPEEPEPDRGSCLTESIPWIDLEDWEPEHLADGHAAQEPGESVAAASRRSTMRGR